MKDYYVKIQTMGLSQDAAIVSIAVININNPDDHFYSELNWRYQERTVDKVTLDFWNNQNEIVKRALNGRSGLSDTLEAFSQYLTASAKSDRLNARLWAYHSAFTFGILENSYDSELLDLPWKPWNLFDVATLEQIKRPDQLRSNFLEPHRTLDDAIKEAKKLRVFVAGDLSDA